MADEETPQFKHATIKEVFALAIDPSTRINAAALQLSVEYLRLFTVEALHRSAEEAGKDTEKKVGPSLLEAKHLQKVMAGLLLDF